MSVVCPACDAESEDVYRCSECGHDLAKTDGSTTGRQGVDR